METDLIKLKDWFLNDTELSIKDFVEELYTAGKLYHFEDDIETIVDKNNKCIHSPLEKKLIHCFFCDKLIDHSLEEFFMIALKLCM